MYGIATLCLFGLFGAQSFGGTGRSPTQSGELPCVLVRDGRTPLTEAERKLLKLVPASEEGALRRDERYVVFMIEKRAFILVDRRLPMLRAITDERVIAASLVAPGKVESAGKLSNEFLASAASLIEQYSLNPKGLSASSRVALRLEPRFEFRIGERKIGLSLPVRGGGLSASDARMLLENPVEAETGTARPALRERAEGASLAVFFPKEVRESRSVGELGEAAITKLREVLAAESEARDESIRKLCGKILDDNASLGLADLRKGMGKDELPKQLADLARDQFIRNYSAFGFDSAESAEAAWPSVVLGDWSMQVGLSFGYKRPDGSRSITVLVFASWRP